MKKKWTVFMVTILILAAGICQISIKSGDSGKMSPEKTAASVDSGNTATADELHEKNREKKYVNEEETQPTENPAELAARERVRLLTSIAPLRNSAQLDVEEINQYPELPTGCESVALTAALRYLGFPLEKTEFAEKYLSNGLDVMWEYVGDPEAEDGAGIYPPGLVRDANEYLKEQKADYIACNTMGTEMESLYKLIDSGYPVLVWTTLSYEEPLLEDYGYFYYDEAYMWYQNEHCVVLCGYDLEEQTVTLMDPTDGITICDAQQFTDVYDAIGRLSMTIIENK